MSRIVILVIDGLGVGAMPDAADPRPGDAAADTLGHLLDEHRTATGRRLPLPALEALGLGFVHPHPDLAPAPSLPVAVGRAALGYPGADTYAGHQTMMGADFSRVTVARLAGHLGEVAAALRASGRRADLLAGRPVLVVGGRVLVHDNLEADPGVNWNVSGLLADNPFTEILDIARVVRSVAPVARVIAVGGRADGPLDTFVRDGDLGTVGLDTPASGFYRNGGLVVRHLGAPLDHARRLPELASGAGAPVTLVGKAADVLACDTALCCPAVGTAEVLGVTADAVRRAPDTALIVSNVQETDLAGHQQDAPRYAAVLRRTDAGLGTLLRLLSSPGDRLIVTGDHGNDPVIGHAHHTREYVPVLIHRPEATGFDRLPMARTLADVGATAAAALGLPPAALGNGTPLLRPVGGSAGVPR
ncbi:phosphopentomutase [Streptomyces albofaciens JCM 4342]|uniref:phosphopentomutase n=1 Tax=Streptomyces albofaciens TaxID=66866 RepID=UPI001238F543|nr:phosphopentomutase [Streptomyces albofaciens]KAA6213730.1 phosphopentomutase [Streptomyces albofaciens JCM 4342]